MLGPVADLSGTPLRTKLGIGDGATVALIDAPGDLLSDLPASVVVKRRASGRAQVVVAFFTSSARLDRRIDHLGSMIFPSGALWVAWPKRSSGKASDLTDNIVREGVPLARPSGQQGVLHRPDVVSAQAGVAARAPVALDQSGTGCPDRTASRPRAEVGGATRWAEGRPGRRLRRSTAGDTAEPSMPAECGP